MRKSCSQPAKALSQARTMYAHDIKTSGDRPVVYVPHIENKTLCQFNLIGDPEVPIWTGIPSQLETTFINDTNTIIEVTNANNSKPVANVTVTLLNDSYFWRGFTDDDGKVTLPVKSIELNNLCLTLSKNDYLPLEYGKKLITQITTTTNANGLSTNYNPYYYETTARSTSSVGVLFTVIAIYCVMMIKKKDKPIELNN